MQRQKWTAEMDERLKMSYPRLSNTQIALQMGMSERSINSRAYRLGLKKAEAYRRSLLQEHNRQLQLTNRRYACNHSYFSCIDTREKAYWLGWLWSDGYVRENNHAYHIELNLQKRDEHILWRFRDAVNAEYPIQSHRESVRICLISQQMFTDLQRYGVVQGKSHFAAIPNIGATFVSDFIRGVFDGDGSIGITYQPAVTIIGTEPFCRWLQQTVQQELGIQSAVYRKKNAAFKWVIVTRTRIRLFAQWIYRASEDGSLPTHLERKYDKFVSASLI